MNQEETMYGDISGANDTTQYKSVNTEVLGWVAEVCVQRADNWPSLQLQWQVVSGKSLTKLVAENVEGVSLPHLHLRC